MWFQISGAVYAAITVMGFMVGDSMIFGFISNSRFDAWGHAGLALIMLLIGFASQGKLPLFNSLLFVLWGHEPSKFGNKFRHNLLDRMHKPLSESAALRDEVG